MLSRGNMALMGHDKIQVPDVVSWRVHEINFWATSKCVLSSFFCLTWAENPTRHLFLIPPFCRVTNRDISLAKQLDTR